MMHKLDKRGDTLIEVVISLAVLASILTVATTGAVNAWRVSRLAGERTVATSLAQRQADALKALKRSYGWTNFKSLSIVSSGNNFYMKIDGTKWIPSSGVEQPSFGSVTSPFKVFIKRTSLNAAGTIENFDVRVEWNSTLRPTNTPELVQLGVSLGQEGV